MNKHFQRCIFTPPATIVIGSMIAMLLGCAPQARVKTSDPDAAITLLDASFQAWKDGRSTEDLRQSSPPIYVAEDLWRQGFHLTDYSIDGSGEVFGTNVRLQVTVKGTDTKGKQISRQLRYLVTTTPALTIAREDR